MPKVELLKADGGAAGSVDLDDAVFGIEPNTAVMHQVVTAQLANRRSGTQSTKTRAEVSMTGAKPWKQKGTGRARAGSFSTPNMRGGGVAHAPKPRDYSQRTPKKMKRLALHSALSDRAAEGKVLVVDAWSFETPSTKSAKAALAAIGAEGKVLVICDDVNAVKSFRNLADVHVLSATQLNVYDILVSDVVVFTKDNLPVAPVRKRRGLAAVPVAEDPTIDSDDDGAVNPDDATPFGPGSAHPLEGGEAPSAEYTIKGNADSMLYHPPTSPFYGRTVAEVWFTTAEAAEAAGFSLPPSLRDDEAADAGEEE
jgi:large subunit ribosomal protein L4